MTRFCFDSASVPIDMKFSIKCGHQPTKPLINLVTDLDIIFKCVQNLNSFLKTIDIDVNFHRLINIYAISFFFCLFHKNMHNGDLKSICVLYKHRFHWIIVTRLDIGGMPIITDVIHSNDFK